jgi:3-hydroxyisobutyrate dehydrogenase
MGTTSPAYSRELEADIRSVGGTTSRHRYPGHASPLTQANSSPCSPATQTPSLTLKLSVNLFLISLVIGLAEAVHFADRQGLNLNQFVAVLNAGPMASEI